MPNASPFDGAAMLNGDLRSELAIAQEHNHPNRSAHGDYNVAGNGGTEGTGPAVHSASGAPDAGPYAAIVIVNYDVGTAQTLAVGLGFRANPGLHLGWNQRSDSSAESLTLASSEPPPTMPGGAAYDTTTSLSLGAPPSTTYGIPIIFMVSVSSSGAPTPSGGVQIEDSGTVIASGTLTNGSFSTTVSNLSVGDHAFIARFLGGSAGPDTFNASSSGTQSLTIAKASTNISSFMSTPNPNVYGTSFTLTASLGGFFTQPGVDLPTGSIQFKQGSTVLGTAGLQNSFGFLTATLPVSGTALTPGTSELTAVYLGDNNYEGSSGTLIQTVNKALSTTTLTVTPTGGSVGDSSVYGQEVTLTAKVESMSAGAGTPTGSVLFRESFGFGFYNNLGTRTLSNGLATLTTSTLSVGTHNLEAVYDETASFLGSTGFAPHTVNPAPMNQAPVLDPIGSRIVDEETSLSFFVSAFDPDDDPLTYSASGPGSFDADTHVFTWTLDEHDGPGTYEITFTVTDDGGLSDSETVLITVNEVNRAPVLGAVGNQTVDEETTLTLTLSATDPDYPANSLTYSISGLPFVQDSDNPNTFTWTPTEDDGPTGDILAGQPGPFPVTITVTDSAGLSDSEAITISVNEVNQDPVLDAVADQTVYEMETLTFSLSATDDDIPLNELTYSVKNYIFTPYDGGVPGDQMSGGPEGLSVNPSTGAVSWKPTLLQAGTYLITFLVDDGAGGEDEKQAQVEVRPLLIEKVEWIALNSPLSINENPGGGLRIFPDDVVFQDPFGASRDQVLIRVTLNRVVADVPIFVKIIDVDDPSTSNPIIDREGNPADNRRDPGMADFEGKTSKRIIDGKEVAVVEFIRQVSKQPGNNYRAVASLQRTEEGDLDAEQNDGDRARVRSNAANGAFIGYTPARIVASGLLTVWRRLHVEVDSMGKVEGNTVIGTITNVSAGPTGTSIVTTNLRLGKEESADTFQNGKLRDSTGRVFDVIGNGTGRDFIVTVKNAGFLGSEQPVEGAFSLIDDDEFKDGMDLPMPDTSQLPGAMAEAYVGVLFDVGDSNNDVPFQLHVDTEGHELDRIVKKNWDSQKQNSETFWVAYILGAFQGPRTRDRDPNSEGAAQEGTLLGATGKTHGGSLIFLESIRDFASGADNNPTEEEQDTVVHEVAHAVANSSLHPVTNRPLPYSRYKALYLDHDQNDPYAQKLN